MKYKEWVAKLSSFVASKWSAGLPWFAWATKSTETIKDEDLDLEYGAQADEDKIP